MNSNFKPNFFCSIFLFADLEVNEKLMIQLQGPLNVYYVVIRKCEFSCSIIMPKITNYKLQTLTNS